jgi:hypothetical protein
MRILQWLVITNLVPFSPPTSLQPSLFKDSTALSCDPWIILLWGFWLKRANMQNWANKVSGLAEQKASLLGFKRIELNYTMSLSLATWKPCVVNASQSQESQASYPLGLVVGHQLIDGGCSGHLQQNWLSRGVRVGRHMTQGARWGTSSLALALHADSSCHALGARVWQASDVFWECQHLGVSFPLLRLIRWGVTWKETVKEAR